MRVKKNELKNNNQTNNAQSSYVPSGVAICRDGDFWTRFAPVITSCGSGETTARGENGVVYSHKIYDYKYQESPPSIKVTRNLVVCESLG